MNIVILEHEPYQDRKRQHYFIDHFTNDNFNVEYWSLHKILPYMKGVEFSYMDEESFVKYFNSLLEFSEELLKKNPNDTILIVELWFNYKTKNIFKLISNRNFKWVRIDYYMNPTKSLDATAPLKEVVFRSLIEGSFLRKVKDFVVRKLLPNSINIPNVLFHTGRSVEYLSEAKKYASLDYYDVNTYNEKKNIPSILGHKYIVFLDIMLVNHPDIARSGNRDILKKNVYFSELLLVFDKLEKYYNLPIVIASHPKANYTNEFGDRLIIKNKTAELVINSEKVLTHGSLSISYALLSSKKIIYIDLKKLFQKNLFLRNIQESMYLASDKILATLIDESFSEEVLNEYVSVEVYEKFLQNYFLKKDRNFEMSNFEVIKQNILDC